MRTLLEALLRDFEYPEQFHERTYQYINGKLHGKVIEEGKEVYYWLGKEMTKEAFEQKLLSVEDNKIHRLYLDGEYYEVNGKKLKELKVSLEPYKLRT